MKKSSKIYIAGHKGLVGSAIYRMLQKDGYNNLITRTHQELDLTRQDEVENFFEKEKPEYVFLAAAYVGGILANSKNKADFIYNNTMIEFNVINNSFKNNVKKLIFLGSSCIYPRDCKNPIKEEYLLSGSLESTNEGYALAKIAGLKYAKYLSEQYNANYISVMPTNLYGINDNYNSETSHVIPGIINKMHKAKINEIREVKLWGTGKPLREFMFADDLADACIFLMENYNGTDIVNIGTGEELTIAELAEKIKNVVGYEGKIIFDSNYPDGTYRKKLDLTKLDKMNWKSKIKLDEGLKMAYDDYLKRIGE